MLSAAVVAQAINDPSTWLGIIASILLTNVALSDVLGWLTTDEADSTAASQTLKSSGLTDAEIDESRYWDLNESAGLSMDNPAVSASAASAVVPPPLPPSTANFKSTAAAATAASAGGGSFKASMAATADLPPVIGVFREHEGPRQ